MIRPSFATSHGRARAPMNPPQRRRPGETKPAARLGKAERQQSGVFRRSLEPRVGAWELIRTALGYTLTLPLGVPLYAEADYLPRAIECLLHCLLKTDV